MITTVYSTGAQATVATTVTAAPRDLEQIRNMKIIRKLKKNNADCLASRDALYNLHMSTLISFTES